MKRILFNYRLEIDCQAEIKVPEASYGDPEAYASMVLSSRNKWELLEDAVGDPIVRNVEFANEEDADPDSVNDGRSDGSEDDDDWSHDEEHDLLGSQDVDSDPYDVDREEF